MILDTIHIALASLIVKTNMKKADLPNTTKSMIINAESKCKIVIVKWMR